VLGNP
jgi:hypothetical protein